MADFIPYTTEQILDLFKSAFYEQTQETLKIGSDEFAFSSVASYVLRVFEQALQHGANNLNLDTASGSALDNLAGSFGVKRPDPQYARLAVKVTKNGNISGGYFGIGEIYAEGGGTQWRNKIPINFDFFTSNSFDVLLYAGETGAKYNGVSSIEFSHLIPSYDDLTFEQKTISFGGTDSIDNYTPENDEAFRAYLKTQIKALSVGTAEYYEQQAIKGNDDIIWDAYCLRDGDTGFEPGKAKIMLAINPSISATSFKNAFLEELNSYLNSDEVKCVTDFVQAQFVNASIYPNPDIKIVYKSQFKALSPSNHNYSLAQLHYGKCANKYNEYLRHHINAPFLLSEFSDILCTPDEDGVYAVSVWINDAYVSPTVGSFMQLNSPTWGGSYFLVEWID